MFLVADEVFTGYGRTGPMWACEHAGIAPDLLCTAKGFSGGMLPMAATLATPRLFAGFLGGRERAFYYGHSFCGNPLGAAVALEVLRVYDDERILERAAPKAARIADAFAKLGALPGVARTRALGMIGALDLAGGDGYLADIGWRVYEEARARGAYLRPLGNVIYVAPPLNIDDADLDALLAIVSESVAAVQWRRARPRMNRRSLAAAIAATLLSATRVARCAGSAARRRSGEARRGHCPGGAARRRGAQGAAAARAGSEGVLWLCDHPAARRSREDHSRAGRVATASMPSTRRPLRARKPPTRSRPRRRCSASRSTATRAPTCCRSSSTTRS